MKRLLLLMACAAAAACSADWRDTSLPPQKRAELLTAEMTLDEKIGQLTSPYGWEMYERHGDSVRLTDAFREAVQNGHIGMLWGTFRADPWTQKDLRTGLTPQLAARLAGIPGVEVFFCPDDDSQTAVLSFRAEGRDCEELGEALAARGAAVRAGLHCAPLAHRSAGTAQSGTVRVSFSVFNCEEEVAAFLRAVKK